MLFGEHSCSFLLSLCLVVEMLNQQVDICLALVGPTFKADCASYQCIAVQCQIHPYYPLCDNEAGPISLLPSGTLLSFQERVLAATSGVSGFSSWF